MNNLDELCVNTIRMLSVDCVEKANSGHPGMPMGMADGAGHCGVCLVDSILKAQPGESGLA